LVTTPAAIGWCIERSAPVPYFMKSGRAFSMAAFETTSPCASTASVEAMPKTVTEPSSLSSIFEISAKRAIFLIASGMGSPWKLNWIIC
jgi:hypothetical protein